MNDNFFLQILMRERERDILEEVRRCDYQTHRRRRDSGSSKEIDGWLLSALKRMKVIARLRQNQQQAANRMAEISDPPHAIFRS